MCGIGGILRVWPAEQRELALRTPHAESIPEQWLNILDDSIKHRGPDGQGRFRDRAVWTDGCVVDVAFVHRRLSIIDHAGGAQPMVMRIPSLKGAPSASSGSAGRVPGRLLSVEEREAHNRRVLAEGHSAEGNAPELALGALGDDERVAVVFNGCIYNHRELRAELQRAGHVFSTDHSDTEVLVHGWREWNLGLLERINGMYAAAIWDGRRGELLLGRDGFGEKPLYELPGELESSKLVVFGSSPPGLWRLKCSISPIETPEDSWRAIKPWIKFGWNQGFVASWSLREIIAGIPTVHPRRAKEQTGNGSSGIVPWFNGVMNPTRTSISVDQVDRLVSNAVASRLEADVPIGCFLSGGIDSALIAALASRTRPDIRAYTVRMPDPSFDESSLAGATARAIGVRHQILNCDSQPAEDLVSIIHQLGLPFGDSSLLPSLWVSRAARREVKVVLAGNGGDELFLGYDRHRAIPWLAKLNRLPRETREAFAASLGAGRGRGRRSRLDRLARLASAAAYAGYKELVAIFPSPLDMQLGLARDGRSGWGEIQHFGLTTADADPEMMEILALRFDRMFYLPCDLERKSDTASMSVALEVRAPFLETNLARATINAPRSSLMPRGQRKGLLRQVARKYLPAEIVDRPKMGFAIPIGEWFRTDYGGLRTMLLDHLNSTEPFGPPSLGIDLNMAFVRQMLDEHLGTGPSGLVKRDHSQRLYMLLVLSIWAKWLGGLR